MRSNRIKEFRKAAGLSQEKLAEEVGLSHTQVQRIETGKRGLSVPRAELFAKALGKPVQEVLGLDPTANAADHSVTSKLTNEAEPYIEGPGRRLRLQPRKGERIEPWIMHANSVDRAGVTKGQVRFVDRSADAVENVKALQCVIALIYTGNSADLPIAVIRQFVPPSLLITNSDTEVAMPLDVDKGHAFIDGVILDDFTGG